MKDKLERLRQKAREAMRARREHREIVAEGSQEPAAGNLYIIPVDLEIPLRVALIFAHPDDEELFFALPVDDFMWEGPTDIMVAEHPLGPMVVRANHGMWLPVEEMGKARLVGRLDDELIHRTRRLLSDMVTGELSPTEEQLETEELEEYEDWVEEVEEALGEIDAWMNRSAVVIDFGAFQQPGPEQIDDEEELEEESSPQRLAAASGGLSARLRDLDDDSEPSTLSVDKWGGPGSLKLMVVDGKVTVVLEASVEEAPAGQVHFNDGTVKAFKWLKFPGGGVWRTEGFALNRVSSLSVVQGDRNWMELKFQR